MYAPNGDVIVIVIGSGSSDELECSVILDAVINALIGATHAGHVLSESKILNSYARVCLVLDGVATNGVADTIDQLALKRTSKWVD